jgi:ribosomal protein S18 acetylase RimI-like enzyme
VRSIAGIEVNLDDVRVTSLGFRTDIAIRALEGSVITDDADFVVIHSPENPQFRWGNFLLLREPPDPGSSGRWVSLFRREFPGVGYVALGIDAAGLGELPGFDTQVDSVLTATHTHAPRHPNHDAEYRPLTTDADWHRATQLAQRCNPHDPDFIRRRMIARRRLTLAGHGAWYGAFRDGELLAHLGIFTAEPGIARFQDVETDPDARRQGLAGTLVQHAAAHAAKTRAVGTLVMVADPDGDAIRLYRSLGFTDTEQQVSLEHLPAAGLPVPTRRG